MSIRSRHAVVLAMLVATLGACKKESSEKDKPTGEPRAAVDAAAKVAVAPDAAAAAPAADAGLAPPATVTGAPFLWKVEKDGVAFHLFGSVHLGVEPDKLPKIVWDTVAAAKTFAMETDLGDPMQAMQQAMRTDGSTLEQELGPEHWKKLEERLGPQLAAGFNKLKTYIAAATIELSMVPMTKPMDVELRNKAEAGGAKIVFLEPMDLQQKLLEKWLDARGLKELLDDYDAHKAKMQEMLAAYAAGDGDKVGALSLDRAAFLEGGGTEQEFEEMKQEMLLDRNASWIPVLEKHAGDGLVAVVGVGHLLGEGSVIDLLEQKGWKATRVTP